MDTSKLSILVVEDEESIRRGLCDALAFHGYAPAAAEDGESGLREALSGDYALVLLDIMLPGRSGLEVCSALRQEQCDVPIIMLTARGSESDVLDGFRSGSDDYVTKPFSVAELMARIEALLRRASQRNGERADAFEFGPWRVEPSLLEAHNGEKRVELSRRELGMLSVFARERGRIVSRRLLLREVWGMRAPETVQTRTVDMHIAKLRKKLGRSTGSKIETVRGEGYRFEG